MGGNEPLAQVPKVTDVEVVLRRLVARAESPVELGALREASNELLGEQVIVAPLPMFFRAEADRAVGAPAAVVRPPSGDDEASVVIEFDTPLARAVIDRTLGGDDASVPASDTGPLSEAECGVLAFAFAQLLSELCDWRLEGVASATSEAARVLRGSSAVALPLEVRVGDRAGQARLWVNERAARALGRRKPTNDVNPVVPVVCDLGRATLSARELRTVGPGDAITLDAFWGGDPASPMRCHARMLTSDAVLFECAQREDGLAIKQKRENAVWFAERGARMSDDPTVKNQPTIDDLPIEIAVEVARTQLPIREFAALQQGEVLLTGQPLHGQVTLRTAGQAIATGELVQIDGEIAVRVTAISRR